MQKKIADLRQNYSSRELSESNIQADPIRQFDAWFSEALEAEVAEPNAMALATADAKGRPSCRIVLLKGFDEHGFVFFSNYRSHKGADLDENPFAALTFLWLDLERQVRIEGAVEKTSSRESDIYFHSRPAGSRIGTWASPQSRPILKQDLIDREIALADKYHNTEIPRPEYWGGYRVIPEMIEFWQGRPNRMHDRIVYRKKESGWDIERLAP